MVFAERPSTAVQNRSSTRKGVASPLATVPASRNLLNPPLAFTEAGAAVSVELPKVDKDPFASISLLNDITNLYFEETKLTPLLTSKEEVLLGDRIQAGLAAEKRLKQGELDPDGKLRTRVAKGDVARDHMTKANTGLVVSVAKQYKTLHNVPFLDLVQEGNIGLMKAVVRFDPNMGCRFSTYATWWIKQAIQRAIARSEYPTRIPDYLQEDMGMLIYTRKSLIQKLGEEPTPEKIASEMDLPVKRVITMMEISRPSISLDTPIQLGNGPYEADVFLFEAIPDKTFLAVGEEASYQGLVRWMCKKMKEEGISNTHIKMAMFRWGVVDGSFPTLDEIGEKFGVSREAVRQALGRAFRVLKSDDRFWSLVQQYGLGQPKPDTA